MQTLFDHRPTQTFAQKGRGSHEIERISQLFLSLSDFQPRQPLARSAPCFAGFLSERTDKAMSSGKSSENASSESSNYVRGKVLFWIKRDCGAGGVRSTGRYMVERVLSLSPLIMCEGEPSSGSAESTTEACVASRAFHVLGLLRSPEGAGIAQAMKKCGERETGRQACLSQRLAISTWNERANLCVLRVSSDPELVAGERVVKSRQLSVCVCG